MLRILLAGVLLFFVIQNEAQETNKQIHGGKISGKIIDSLSGKPIEYATITLFQQGNKKVLNGTVTDKQGVFTLADVSDGAYQILIEFIGYRSHTINNIIINKKNQQVNLNTVSLAVKSVTLQNVVVTAPNRLIENKIDKIVFNAERDITSQGGVATDVLKKVPQVSVDLDGNVELSGSSSIQFLINGKPSSAFGSNIADVLQSIPANQIKSIEVVTNPGAKYDAQGLGGIINIILKESKVKGVNGNVSLTAGTRNENGSLNFNARHGNIGFNAFVSGNEGLNAKTPSSSDRLTNDTVALNNISLQQDAISQVRRHGMQSGFGFDWTYKKRNDFTGSLRYGNFGFISSGFVDQSQITTTQSNGALLSDIATINNTDNNFHTHNIDANLSYKRTFAKEDQELNISLNTYDRTNHGIASNNQFLMPQDSLYYGTNNVNPGKQNQSELQLDYTQPFKKDIKLGIGGKIIFTDISSLSNISNFQPDTKEYAYNSFLSNNLDYKQKIYAFYSQLTFPIANLFDAQIGGRYERTQIDAFYSNAQQQTPPHGYNTFVPSIYFSRKLTEAQTLKLSYSKRIERPDYGDLNPFINTTDPKNISTGNPYLQPEIGQRYELSYSKDFEKAGSFMVSAFYRTSDHDIQPFIVYYPSLKVGDSTFTNVAVSTRENIGTEKNIGANFFVDLKFSSKLSVRSNFFFFKRHTINVLNPGYNSNSFNYRFNMNATYQFNKDFVGEFFGNFNSARHEAQGKYPSFTSYSFALRKQFWNKKGSIALVATNPFKEYVDQRTQLFGPNFIVNGLRQVPYRSIGINFTWKFGKLEFKKEKEDNQDNGATVPEG